MAWLKFKWRYDVLKVEQFNYGQALSVYYKGNKDPSKVYSDETTDLEGKWVEYDLTE
jgi:hypothetical protein